MEWWRTLPHQPIVAAVSVFGGLGCVLAGAQPTGLGYWDPMLSFLLGGLVIAAASVAPRWVVIVMASVASAAIGLSLWSLIGWIALLVAVATSVFERRNRTVAAIVAAISMQLLFRIPPIGFFGLPSVISGTACALCLVMGYRYGSSRVRERARRGVLVIAAAAAALTLMGGFAVITARSDVDQGTLAARRAIDAAEAGETDTALVELDVADAALARAASTVQSPWARGLRLVPVVAQHHRALEVGVVSALSVSESAAASINQAADIESLALDSGSVDLEALRATAPFLRDAADALQSSSVTIAGADSGWLAPPIRNRLREVLAEIDELVPDVELAAEAAEIVPAMLGAETKQTYFVMFGTPAESRELGGLLGSWALVTFDNGEIELQEAGRIKSLIDSPTRPADPEISPGSISEWFESISRPAQFPQNLTGSADLSEVATATRQIVDPALTTTIDGVIYVDPWALVAMLELTGPVQTEFNDEPLTTENGADFFFDEQYRLNDGGEARTELFLGLADVASTVLDELTSGPLPGPETIGRVLGPAARGGRLQMVTFDDEQNEFLRSVRLLRDFGRTDTEDFIAVVQGSATPAKLDLYLDRALNYDVQVDEDGRVDATATLVLSSTVPSDAPTFAFGPSGVPGDNALLVSLYSPHVLTGVFVDGQEATFRSTSEFDLDRYLVEIFLPPTGEPSVVEFQLVGAVNAGRPYSLEVWHQPLVNNDEVSVSYGGPDGAFGWQGALVENKKLTSVDGFG